MHKSLIMNKKKILYRKIKIYEHLRATSHYTLIYNIIKKKITSESLTEKFCIRLPAKAGYVRLQRFWILNNISFFQSRPVEGIFPVHRPRFPRKSVADGIFKMPSGAKTPQNRARWTAFGAPPGALQIYHVDKTLPVLEERVK